MIVVVMIMKKPVKILREMLKAGLLIWAAYYCMTDTADAGAAVSGAVERCLATVIPSLYAMMIVSGLIVKSGACSVCGRLTGRAGRFIFGMDTEVFPVFLFSMAGGYPVGAKMLISLYSDGKLSKHRTELLSGVCFGAGPAFVAGCISGQLYGTPTAGHIILISTISANLITAFALSFVLRKSAETSAAPQRFRLSGSMLTDCISSAGRSMAEICFTIAAFAVFSGMLDSSGIMAAFGNDLRRQTVLTFLDVTAAGELPRGNYTLLPLLSAAVSFGGVCVLFQIASIFSGKLSMLPLILTRAAASALSFGICRLIMPFMLRNETVTAAVTASVHRAPSPVPSVMLILMTFAVLRETVKDR